ncbi:protein ABHD13 [Hydra vulgaris]|uniref:Protein ABHD13 n=1 Tax=Hydra vulgaris TaxID=6087 RepID=A0ABM4BSF9_HYDVU
MVITFCSTMENHTINEKRNSLKRSGFRSIETIGRLVLSLIIRFWKACSVAMLFIFLLYWLYGGIITVFLLSAAFVGAFYHYQDALLYFPDQPENSRIYVQSPRYLGVPYENLYIKTRDGITLNAIFLKQSGSRLNIAPTIIMLHGNAGNIGHRFSLAQLLYMYTGSNIFLLDYRGYGKSDGMPSEKGFELDAIAAIEYLLSHSDIDHNKLVLYGSSLGGAVTFAVAFYKKYMNLLFAIIVENTFTSIPDMARHLFILVNKLPSWCYKNKFPSIDRVAVITTPTLFLSGLADQLVPPKQMVQLYNSSGACLKRIERFDAGSHNDTWQCNGYMDSINNFLNEVYEARKNGLIAYSCYRQTNEDDIDTIIDL